MSGLTEEILKLVAHASTSGAELDLAERAFADTVAVLVAGAVEPGVAMVEALVDEQGGTVTSLATGRPMSARSAALVDGTSAHALDYDDVDDDIIGHPSAALVPALLAVGQDHDTTGLALLQAYLVGLESGRAVGRAVDIGSHYAAGWHTSSSVGTIAVAAAISHLLGLDEQATRHALGIAGSLAGGSRQNFGTMTKPLHVGSAASQGLSAAYLAARGFTADPSQLDGPLGFLALHRAPAFAGPSVVATTSRRHTESAIGVGSPMRGLNLKLFPSCYAGHAAIEATLDIARRVPQGSNIASVEVSVQPGGLIPLIHHRPVDGTEAKFSMEYAVAVALLDGEVSLASFTDERAARDDVQSLLRRVELQPASGDGHTEQAEHGAWFAVVAVHTTEGTTLTARVDDPIGHASRPLSEDQLREKFAACCAVDTGISRDAAAAYLALRNLRDQASAREVAASVTSPRSAREHRR